MTRRPEPTQQRHAPQLGPVDLSQDATAGLDRDLCSAVKKAVRTIEPTAEVLLYGSRARGHADPDADWDFLILVDGPVEVEYGRKKAIRHRLYDVELQYEAVLSSLIVSRDQWNSPLYRAMPLHQNVERDGIHL